jgi:hypothetical protein
LRGRTSGIYSLAFSGQAATLHFDIYFISFRNFDLLGHEIYLTAVPATLAVAVHCVANIARTVSTAQGSEDARSFTHSLHQVKTSTTVSEIEMICSKCAHTLHCRGTSADVVPMPFTFRKIVWPVLKFSPEAETMGIRSQSVDSMNVSEV